MTASTPSTSTSPGRLAGAMADPRFDRYRATRPRRLVSLVQIALSLAIAGGMAASTGGNLPLLVASVLLILPWMLVTGALNASVHGLTELADRDLDELQRRLRDAAYRRSYRILSAATVLFALALFFTIDRAMPPALTTGAAMSLVLSVLSLPVHLLAWSLPSDDA
jgi:hypothetical protein